MDVLNNEFTNFKVHTQYSICEGAIKIEELAEYCKTNKIKSIGLCDSYNLCGSLEFAEKISKTGTHPIIGTQINFLIDGELGKLPLFATTKKGYQNLVNLSSKSFLDKDELSDPHCIFEVLEKYNEGLIILSGSQNDLFGKLYKLNKIKKIDEHLLKLQKLFKDRFYIEIQRHNEPNEKEFESFIIQISKKYQIPLIASQEIFYINQEMSEAHNALVCIGEKRFLDDPQRMKYNDQHFLKKSKDLKEIFKDIPEALENNFNFPLI